MRKKKNFPVDADNFEKVFTHEHLYQSFKKCILGVSWKSSVQKYKAFALENIHKAYVQVHNGTYRSRGFTEFYIHERGKTRWIRSIPIEERVVQRCLTDNALLPVLSKSLIYDCGACLKGKGYTFAKDRCRKHLHDYIREHGTDGYVLLFDFSKYFDNIDHSIIERILEENFTDRRLIDLTMYFVKQFGDKGLGLGSHISQILALVFANKLDHYIKEVLRIKYYARYMDDGYLIHPSKEYLLHCKKEIERICKELNIILNPSKVQLVKLRHGFTFLQCRYQITESGRVISKISHNSIGRQRRKLKKLHKRYREGKMSLFDCAQSIQSWMAYADHFDSYQTKEAMGDLFRELFGVDYRDVKYERELWHTN